MMLTETAQVATAEGMRVQKAKDSKNKHYHKKVALSWGKLLEIQPHIMVKSIAMHVKQKDGKPFDMAALNKLLKDKIFAISASTGYCSNSQCDFKHGLPLPDPMAALLCKVIEKATGKLC